MRKRTREPSISRSRMGRNADAGSARGTFFVIMFGLLPLPMSMSGASIAMPHIGADLDTGGATAQWVVTGYFLTASSLMLVAGSVSDAYGRRRVYRLGAVTYAVGSLAAAVAPSIGILLAARILTGVGAAGMMAAGAAILAATFTGAARTRAFAAMGVMAGVGLALGPSMSGWIIEALGWRAGFGVFALAGLGLFVGTWLMRETRAGTRPRMDVAGAAVLALSMAALMLAVSQGPTRGWVDPLVLGALAAGVFGVVILVPIQRRAPSPLLDPALLRNRRFMGWTLAAATTSFGYGGVLAFLPSYLQSPAGYSAGLTGLIVLLPTIPMVLLPPMAAHLIRSGVSPTVIITVALLLLAAGNVWLTTLHPAIGIIALSAPLLTLGAGVGLAAGIIDAQAMNQIDTDRAGLAAGMLNTIDGVANTLIMTLFGAALIGLLTVTVDSADLAGRVATGNIPSSGMDMLAERLSEAWRLVLLALAGLCAFAAAATGLLVRRAGPDRESTRPVPRGIDAHEADRLRRDLHTQLEHDELQRLRITNGVTRG